MRKYFICCIVFFIFALNFSSAQLRVGIRGGLQVADMRTKPDDRTVEEISKLQLGYQLGLVLDYSFNNVIFIQPALQINSKGSKIIQTSNTPNTKLTIQNMPLYVDIPLLLGVRFGVQGLKIFGMGGPYVAYGIGGKRLARTETLSGSLITESKSSIYWGNESSSDLRPLDMGFVVSAGVELSNLQIGLHYTPGFINIAPENSGRKLYNSTLGINATLLLGGNGRVGRFL